MCSHNDYNNYSKDYDYIDFLNYDYDYDYSKMCNDYNRFYDYNRNLTQLGS